MFAVLTLFGLATLGMLPAQSSGIVVYSDVTRTADVFRAAPSQILPASHLILRIFPDAAPDASGSDPAIVRITLPPGVVLTHTLADGPLPGQPPGNPDWGLLLLAVGEFRLDPYGIPRPVSSSQSLTTVGSAVVCVYRAVAGEREIYLLIAESTTNWAPVFSQDFLGVVIGLGPGVWPSSALSNWGAGGIHGQESTFFQADLRQFDFAAHGDTFPVTFDAFWMNTGTPLAAPIQPASANLFTLANGVEGPDVPVASQIGRIITGLVVADLDRDGLEDCCSIDGEMNRLYWAFGRPDRTMQDLGWVEVVGISPRTLAVADVTGDAHPDLLISDANGGLAIVPWEDVFMMGPLKSLPTELIPAVVFPLAGAPSDSATLDVNADDNVDYLYSDENANVVRILLGPSFTEAQTYTVGNGPVAIATGDFDSDGAPEIAVVNHAGGSVSVMINDTRGVFSVTELAGVGTNPVSVDAGDINRDGREDLAIAFAGNKSIGILTAGPGGQFTQAAMQKIFFQKSPSAVDLENYDGLNGPDVLVGFADDSKLALCTSDAAGHLTYAYALNTLADVLVDPFNNVVLPEDSILSVAGGTTVGGVSSRSGVGSIQKQPFDVIHFPRSHNISFAVTNLGTGDALLNLELYNNAGYLEGSSTQTVQSGGQFARYFPDLLGPAAGQDAHWVRGFLSHEDVDGIWLANNGTDLAYLDGGRTVGIRDAFPELTFPVADTAAGRFTTLELINPSRESANVVVKMVNAYGDTYDFENRVIGGRAHLELDVASTFPGAAEGDYLQVSADRPILGMEMFGTGTSLACLEAQKSGQASGLLFSPHLAAGNFGIDYFSRLNVVNSAATAATVRVTLYDDGGAEQAETNLLLRPRAKASADIAALFSLSAPTTGYLVLDPQGAAGIVGSITFGDAGSGAFLSSLPLQSVPSDRFMMCHIANGVLGGVDYFTGLAVLNPNADTHTVRVTAYDATGFPLGSRTLILPGRSRMVSMLHELMPGLTDIFGGYVIVDNLTTTGGVLAFQLFGDWGFQFLSAVPAIPMG